MAESNTVTVDIKNAVATVTLNRPAKRNAMSPTLHLEMADTLEKLRYEKTSRVVVVTGAGEAFCAGMDLKQFFVDLKDDPAEFDRIFRIATEWRFRTLRYYPKPTIAMVNGFCFGGAFTQVCACDFAVAADDATFGLSEVNWGILPGGIVSWNVVQTLNFRDAMYYAMTGDPFDGKEAKQMGFVNFSYPKEKLREETVKLAKKLMEKSPAAMRYTKEAIRAVRFMNEPQAADYLNAKSDALKYMDKENSRGEGMKQFLDEKTYRPGLGHFKRKKVAAK
jgi:trans-feruloyl-CoA hydratase/vanillin synthase